MADKITDLKNKFSTGKIPSETDFAELIDLAGCGNKALGLDEDQISVSATDGLTIKNKQLKVNLAENSGLKKYDDGGLGIVAGKGVKVDQNGVSLNISPQGGIDISAENVMYIKPWHGIAVSETGELSVNVGPGLIIENSSINLNIGDGLELKTGDPKLAAKLAVKLAKDGALLAGTDGLKINVSAGSNDNNIAINEQGKLTLTDKAVEALKEGSKAKFLKALNATQKEAKEKQLIDSEFAVKTDNLNDWEDPILSLVSQANTFGQNEVFRARSDLEIQIKEFLKDKALVKELPSYDSRRLNFSSIATKYLGYLVYGSNDKEYFGLSSLHQFKSKGSTSTPDTFPDRTNFSINYENFKAEGFYAFIGSLSANSKLSIDQHIADVKGFITANAIMVHINQYETTTVGFWDLVPNTAPVWYQNEADPAITPEIKNGAPFPMNRIATVMPGVESDYSIDDQNKTITARSQNTSPIIYSSNNIDLFDVSSNGALTLKAWGYNAGVTINQAATRIHNAVSESVLFNIKPRDNISIECNAKGKNCHMDNIFTLKTTGGNLENNESIKFHYTVEDANILTVVELADHSTYIKPLSPGKTNIHIYQEKNDYYDVNKTVFDFEIREKHVKLDNNLKIVAATVLRNKNKEGDWDYEIDGHYDLGSGKPVYFVNVEIRLYDNIVVYQKNETINEIDSKTKKFKILFQDSKLKDKADAIFVTFTQESSDGMRDITISEPSNLK